MPGYDFSLTYTSFSRYNFCTFDNEHNPLYVNSKIKQNYKTNICVRVDIVNKKIDLFQDGTLIGSLENFKKLHSYAKEPFIYIGCADPNRSERKNFFKGHFDTLAIYGDVLEDNEIFEIANKKFFGLTQNFGNYKSADKLNLYYDTKFIKGYKLMDLSENSNQGEIYNCEIVELDIDEYKEIKIPNRRDSIFYTLEHEENGFLNNKWKTQFTRWNQLRFHNEVSKNDDLLENDGLNNLEFVEYGKTYENNIMHINVGI